MKFTVTMRRASRALWDMAMWIVAMPLALLIRYDFQQPPPGFTRNAILIGIAMAFTQLLVGLAFRLYLGRFRFASFDEVFGVVTSAVLVGFIYSAVALVLNLEYVSRATPAIATGLAIFGMLAGRFALRVWRERFAADVRQGDRTLILGAGDAGVQVLRLMLTDPKHTYRPVGFLDDNSYTHRLRVSGVRVLGPWSQLEDVVQATSATVVVVAVAGIDSAVLRDLDVRCRALGVTLRSVPSLYDIVGGQVALGDISDVTEEDLLGRRPITSDEGRIRDLVAGRRVLVTGAGGSIGSELARQLHRYGPARLVLLDRDESALHGVKMSLDGRALMDSDDLALADIRDAERIKGIMLDTRPDVVFHAAALKHMPMLERAPDEAFKTNVVGTANVLAAATAADVPLFVNISTDKAADPENVLGYSKRTTERLTAGSDSGEGSRYVSVRFGNVLGSRGSMLTTFRQQVADGGPITVTHPDVTRYFMTISEAVHLVLQAATFGRDSETLILDMGEPVRIDDVARLMVEKSGRDIKIVYTGLRPGEKMHEHLVGVDEVGERPFHPLVTHVKVTPLEAGELGAVTDRSAEGLRATMTVWATGGSVSGRGNRVTQATGSANL